MSNKQSFWKTHREAIIEGCISFLKSSWISILIISVFVVLILQMAQGSILLVDLLSRPMNLLLFLAITHILGVVLSLYPVYLSKWRENKQSKTKWEMRPSWLKKLIGFGIITYNDNPNSNPKTTNQGLLLGYNKKSKHFFESILRKLLGVIFYLCILYCLVIIADKYFFFQYLTKNQLSLIQIIFFVVAAIVVAFHFCVSLRNRSEETIKKFRLFLHLFLGLSCAFFALSIYFSIREGWAFETLVMVITHLFFSLLYFIIYRKFRRVLSASQFVSPYLNWLSNDYDYLKMTTIGGWFTLIIFVWSQFQPEKFNPIVIIFSMFYTLYGILVIPIKHHLFYSKLKDSRNKTSREKVFVSFFVYFFPFLPIVYALFVFITMSIGNDQHKLETIPYKENKNILLTENEFFKSFDAYFERQDSTKKEPVFFISSYGGGLRANLWTLKVLNELTRKPISNNSEKTVFNNTIAMSGVSGGGFGVALFQAIYSENPSSWEKRDSIINEIGKMNPLSRDLAWLFGKDYIGELIPLKNFNPSNDRAIAVLNDYNSVTSSNSDMLNLPFQEYSNQVFRQFGYYPATFVNTASYSQKRGIASSFQFNDFHEVFPSSIDILDIDKQKTLSYLHGVSPTHRFPFFSPGAKIENKSIFIDGGYFENSGLLTTFDFYDYLVKKEKLQGRKVIFIQIKNGDMQYAQEFIQNKNNNSQKKIDIKESGEILTILKAITSVSAISNYLEDDVKQIEKTGKYNIYSVSISLPYRISKSQAKKVLFAKKIDKKLASLLSDNNKNIHSYLKENKSGKYISEEAIEPALGRLLTGKVVEYIDRLLKNDKSIFKELDAQLPFYTKEENGEQDQK